MRKFHLISLFFVIFPIFLLNSQIKADSIIRIDVKTILASNKGGDIDPRLRDLVRELKSVFRYSSYQLLSRDRANLRMNRSERISLPGGRMMSITFKGLSGRRATLQLEIYKGKSQIFQTIIQLRNQSSVTVGGPEYRGGYLLFNIYNSF